MLMAESSAGCSVALGGVTVDFPFEPYQCQLTYMQKVIQALQQHTNAILESPTGTGKTLCLLCAALAWREDYLASLRLQEQEENAEDPWDNPAATTSAGAGGRVPKIIYASRTHSQLSHVIKELKSTRYRPKVAVIGSREQLCVHPEVSKKETNSEKVHLCRAKVKSRSCFYYNNTDVKRLRAVESPVMDIEDLVLLGGRHKMCPYYLARDLKSEADIVFMPYNYLLDLKTRQMHGVEVEGAVVILDEAHNIERVCEDSASFDLTSGDLAQCIADIQHILAVKKDQLSQEGEEASSNDKDLQDFMNLAEFFLNVEKCLDGVSLPQSGKREVVKSGRYIFDFLGAAGLTTSTHQLFLEQCSKAISFLTTDTHSSNRNGNFIQKFMDATKIVFSAPPSNFSRGCQVATNSTHQYKVFIKADEPRHKSGKLDSWTTPTPDSSRKDVRTLGYWCFSPGHAMTELAGHGVWSVILTSGTLSPLNSFSSELAIDFPISYEGPHVITERQVWVGVVCKGCDNVPLNSSYANRSSLAYQTSLGNTLVNFSRLVPHGLLVFFPSYPAMHECVNSWRESGIMQRIESYKPVFQEPRRKAEFSHTMEAFYQMVKDPSHSGAAFFAVCRGKVSEGLDFADINGRAVVITGLPYPPRMDPKVTLKMQYLQEAKKVPEDLGGEEWYRQQASRAVNQAVGRVIRHLRDFGAILLCDERFSYASAKSQLPQWLRPHIRTYGTFGPVQKDLRQFFKQTQAEFGSRLSGHTSQPEGGSKTNSSVHLPVVVRGSTFAGGNKAAMERAQDACHVDVHVPSRTIPDGECERHVAMEVYKSKPTSGPKNLMNLLNHCEKSTKKEPVSQPPHSREGAAVSVGEAVVMSVASTDSTAGTSSSRKRKLLVTAKDKAGSREDEGKPAVSRFVQEVQKFLSDDGFSRFKAAMLTYKKTKDIEGLCSSLKDVFRANAHHLLQGMLLFVQKEHRDNYATFYQAYTGRPLPHRTSESQSKLQAL